MKRVLVPLAPGFEEIEAVTVIDLLRRADVEVVVAGVERGPIAGSRGVRLLPDASLDDVAGASFDLVVLPGGRGGTDRLIADSRVHALLRDQVRGGRLVAAICAAPEVLHRAGLLEGRQVTSHPSSRYREDRVVRDGSIITSRAPGTAMEFAFTLVELLCGKEKVREINAVVLGRLDPERNIT